MHELSEKEYEQSIGSGTVLIDFGAEWCGPCKAIMPVVQKLATEYSAKMKTFSVDIDKSPALAAKNGVMSVPTLLILRDGKAVERIVGAVSEKELRKRIEPHLGA